MTGELVYDNDYRPVGFVDYTPKPWHVTLREARAQEKARLAEWNRLAKEEDATDGRTKEHGL